VTQTAAPTTHDVSPLGPESFWAVVYRRSRYALAIVLSAFFFCTLGWQVNGWVIAAPPADWAGVSLVVWLNHGVLAAFFLTFLLLVATAFSSLLVHPDSPHMGMACALLGMAGLSIRGGSIYMLIRYAQQSPHGYAAVSQGLAVECIEWGFIVLIAEVFGRLLHDRFFVNTHWIQRSGTDLGTALIQHGRDPHGTPMGVAVSVSKFFRTHDLNRMLAIPLAMITSGVLSFVLLFVLMQTQQKGQVLMACLVSFYLSTLLTYLMFPRTPILPLLLVVPLTAAVAYLYGMNVHLAYPGHVPFFAMRALPIDYAAAGVPGAIFGYYGGFHWAMSTHEQD
jgi:hypothetical protein